MFDFFMLISITWYFQFSLLFVCFWQSLELYKRKKRRDNLGIHPKDSGVSLALKFSLSNYQYKTSVCRLLDPSGSLSPPQIRQEPWRSLHHSWSQNPRQKLNTRCLQPGDSRGDSSHSGDGNHFLPYPLASTSCSSSYPAPPSSSPLSVSAIIPTYGGWGSDTLYTWFPSGQSLSQSASLCGTMKTI